MPKAFTEQESTLIAQRLLEHGQRLFAAHGLRKTNVEEIARAAGISKGAFYRFYESKEALFMEVIERTEERVRAQALEAIGRPGPSPRARLYGVLREAFALFRTMPELQLIAGSDYDLLFRRVPAETVQKHLESDRAFVAELVARCREAGIPIRVPPERMAGLLYPLVLSTLHEGELGQDPLGGNVEALLELVAAFCLGEVELELQGLEH